MAFWKRRTVSVPDEADPAPYVLDRVDVESDEEGMVRITIPRPRTWFNRLLTFIFRREGYKILTLDETGTRMLGLIDGRRTFSELARVLCEEHSLEEGRAARSMAMFLERLAREGVIGMRLPEDTAREE